MTIKKLYGKYRPKNFDSLIQIKNLGFNGNYSLDLWTGGQFADYALANISGYIEPIPEDRYTGLLPIIDSDENPTGEYQKKQTRFAYAWYSDKYTNEEEMRASIGQVGNQNSLDLFATLEEAKEWLRKNTDLVEDEKGFIISPAGKDMLGNDVEAVYLTIE